MTKQFDSAIKGHDTARELEEATLTPEQQRAWDTTRAALLWNNPAFTHVLYSMMNSKSRKNVALFTRDPRILTAATDGVNLIINPDYFFKFSLGERIFIVAHEIMHCILDHCGMGMALRKRGEVGYPSGKRLPYDDELMNVALDLVVNDLLIESKTGTFNKEWLHDKKYGTFKDSSIDVYERIFKQKNGGGGGQQPPTGKRFDQHMQPGAGNGQDPTAAQGARNPQEWSTAVASANAAAKAQGKLPAALEAFFGALLEPVVSWQEKIQAFFNRKVGSGSYNWRRPDRRLIVRDIYAPGRSGFGAGCVVIGFDTSGSIYADKTLIDRFLAEVSGILSDVKPKRLVVLWCDAAVHRYDDIDELTDLKGLKPVGGGGTDFRPVFKWVREQGIEPDAVVYLTDGYGTFPKHEPSYPVLWGNISGKSVTYPWGEVVDIPKQ